MLQSGAKSIRFMDANNKKPTEFTTGLEIGNTNFLYSGEGIEAPMLLSIERSQCNIKAFVQYLLSKSDSKGVEYTDKSDSSFHMVEATHNETPLGTVVKIAKF